MPRVVIWPKENVEDIEIAVEPLSRATKDCDALLREHWLEIANYKDKVPLEPRWDEIYALEREGRIVTITVREKGQLIGYAMFVLNIHLHYKSLTVATNDILFIKPDKRHGRLGLRLMQEAEKYLKDIGANKITWHMKPHKDFSKLVEGMGYTHEEAIYGKLI